MPSLPQPGAVMNSPPRQSKPQPNYQAGGVRPEIRTTDLRKATSVESRIGNVAANLGGTANPTTTRSNFVAAFGQRNLAQIVEAPETLLSTRHDSRSHRITRALAVEVTRSGQVDEIVDHGRVDTLHAPEHDGVLCAVERDQRRVELMG
jgi:hypothetical protein